MSSSVIHVGRPDSEYPLRWRSREEEDYPPKQEDDSYVCPCYGRRQSRKSSLQELLDAFPLEKPYVVEFEPCTWRRGQ